MDDDANELPVGWTSAALMLDDYERGYMNGKIDGAKHLLAIMQEVRDASSFDLNPHAKGATCTLGVCGCSRAIRITRAWRAFHDALTAGGVPRLGGS